jgi:ADP-heptose:LPS heptosyltransferase
MHMLETYSLVTAMPIDKCFIAEEEIELPSSPYITFHPCDTKGTARQYSYWKEVVDGLKNSPGFSHEIIQVGGEDDDRYDVNTSFLGQTTMHSLAYLIKHSSLHLSYDSFPLHLASHYDTKIVCIFPQTWKATGPFFSSEDRCICLEPNYSDIKPSYYQRDDPNKLINTISPEEIIGATIRLLDRK